jgi:hypothetical protein
MKDDTDEYFISAGVSGFNTSTSEPRLSKNSETSDSTPVEMTRSILTDLQTLKGTFYDNTSSEERAFVRRATYPTDSFRSDLYANSEQILVVGMTLSFVLGIFLSKILDTSKLSKLFTSFRGSSSPSASSSCGRVVDNMLRYL